VTAQTFVIERLDYNALLTTDPIAPPPCPICRSTNTAWLAMQSTAHPAFNFFVCNACGHLWSTDKVSK